MWTAVVTTYATNSRRSARATPFAITAAIARKLGETRTTSLPRARTSTCPYARCSHTPRDLDDVQERRSRCTTSDRQTPEVTYEETGIHCSAARGCVDGVRPGLVPPVQPVQQRTQSHRARGLAWRL